MSITRFDACSRILSELDGRCSTFDFQTRKKVNIEICDVEALAAKYPDVADDLRAFSR